MKKVEKHQSLNLRELAERCIMKNNIKKLNNHIKKLDIDMPDILQQTLLHHVAETGNEEICKILLAKKANPNKSNIRGEAPLHIACRLGHEEVVKQLLNFGADVNSKNGDFFNEKAPLHLACDTSDYNTDIVESLILHGANIDDPTDKGNTPLHLAAKKDNIPIVRLLIKHGANLYKRNNEGKTPLDYAKSTENINSISLKM